MQLVQKNSTVHTSTLKNREVRYIVLHYTAGTSSKQGTARNVASMFANPNNRAASADFIVDDVECVQYNGDIKNRYCYSVGGDKYTVKYTGESGVFYGKCKNSNSVSIEMCSSKVNKKSLLATDRDWSITEPVVKNAAELTIYLMQKYNVPKNRVIMHHHVTGKLCPQPWCIDNNALAGWRRFQAMLDGKLPAANVKKEEPEDMTQRETQTLIDTALTKQKAEIVAEMSKMVNGMKPRTYDTLDSVPDWARPTVEKLVESKAIEGTGEGLGLSSDFLRTLVVLDRLGILDKTA